MKTPSIDRTVTERVTIDLDQADIELAIAGWLSYSYADAFRGVDFKFDWNRYESLPRVTVVGHRSIGERIAP